jgi:hypothetical protein
MDRRECIRSLVRYSVLGGLATMTGMLFLRSQQASPDACINLEICSGCRALNGCALPPAVTYRTVTEENQNAG